VAGVDICHVTSLRYTKCGPLYMPSHAINLPTLNSMNGVNGSLDVTFFEHLNWILVKKDYAAYFNLSNFVPGTTPVFV
jgi:hypothetical protein